MLSHLHAIVVACLPTHVHTESRHRCSRKGASVSNSVRLSLFEALKGRHVDHMLREYRRDRS